jgi:hypothetical protein
VPCAGHARQLKRPHIDVTRAFLYQEKFMNRSVSFKPALWAVAALTAAVMAGCGGGDDAAPAPAPVVTPPAATGPHTCTAGAANCVNLGTAAKYAVLAQSAITSITASAITGDVGLSPGTKADYSGFTLADNGDNTFSTDPQVTGKIFAADNTGGSTSADLTQAQIDAIAAFGAADPAVLTPTVTTGASAINTADCAGATPGVYHFTAAVNIASECTFNGGPDDIWVFQVDGALTQTAGVNVNLTGGAQAKNVLWRVDGAASIGAGSHLEGVVIARDSITLGAGATSTGRLLAGAAVTVDGSTVAQP